MKKKTTIEVSTNHYGVHRWPDAPDHVAYLRHEHCHTFYFCLVIEVQELDREFEFDTVLAELYESIGVLRLVAPGSVYSCEHMADMLFNHFAQRFPSLKAVKVGEHSNAFAKVERADNEH